MPRIVHFEFLADDPERAVKFWNDAFGWKSDTWEGATYWLVNTGEEEPGINGGIMRRSDFPQPVNTICTVAVDDVDDAVAKVEKAGGQVVRPKFEVGDIGLSAYCTDTEGNVFGVWQSLQASE
ncbi:MAG TPA: VOC family protein [Solirubrobacteraceae bacterium]|nr:VOC family protein [Solirubrobacteraceae bacterium]